MYGDYYKVFGMIRDILKVNLSVTEFQNIKDFACKQQYPVYKDLDNKVYDYDMLNHIHADIISVIEHIQAHHQEGKRHIK